MAGYLWEIISKSRRKEGNHMNFNKQKCITAVILLLVAILSITVIGKYASAPENHQKTIASLDEKKQTVMELTAAAPDNITAQIRFPTADRNTISGLFSVKIWPVSPTKYNSFPPD